MLYRQHVVSFSVSNFSLELTTACFDRLLPRESEIDLPQRTCLSHCYARHDIMHGTAAELRTVTDA